jgi:hypothetical protein
MTDDELEARLRRLADAPTKDEPFWDDMAAAVRAGYAAESAPRPLRRRRRWVAMPVMGALALAAAFVLYVRVHRPVLEQPGNEALGDELNVFEEQDTGELIEELTPTELDKLAQAFDHKGA